MEKLKKQKAKLLDDVMETETYKVAKELLDDFATDAEKRQLNVRPNIFPILGGFFVNYVVCQSNHFCKTYNKTKCYEKSQIDRLERNCFEKW